MAEFDKTTHIRNKDGEIVRENHYIMKVTNGETRFERPPKSGNWFNPDGSRIESAKAVDAMAADLLPKEATAPSQPIQNNSANAKSK